MNLDNDSILDRFGHLHLGYNKSFATIEVFEEEQLLFSVFESNPDNANWEFVEESYIDMFEAISRVRSSQFVKHIEELEMS